MKSAHFYGTGKKEILLTMRASKSFEILIKNEIAKYFLPAFHFQDFIWISILDHYNILKCNNTCEILWKTTTIKIPFLKMY